jgi:hypothetical protein
MTNNKQQTAVSFFLMGLIDLEIGKCIPIDKLVELHHLFDKAKEMEKEQIEEAFANGVDDEYEWHINNVPRKNSETYYNETYGGGDQ